MPRSSRQTSEPSSSSSSVGGSLGGEGFGVSDGDGGGGGVGLGGFGGSLVGSGSGSCGGVSGDDGDGCGSSSGGVDGGDDGVPPGPPGVSPGGEFGGELGGESCGVSSGDAVGRCDGDPGASPPPLAEGEPDPVGPPVELASGSGGRPSTPGRPAVGWGDGVPVADIGAGCSGACANPSESLTSGYCPSESSGAAPRLEAAGPPWSATMATTGTMSAASATNFRTCRRPLFSARTAPLGARLCPPTRGKGIARRLLCVAFWPNSCRCGDVWPDGRHCAWLRNGSPTSCMCRSAMR